jgi:hypothetical protein
MDFIERIFGISPDAGSGTFEMILVLVPLVIVGLLAGANRRWRSPVGANVFSGCCDGVSLEQRVPASRKTGVPETLPRDR